MNTVLRSFRLWLMVFVAVIVIAIVLAPTTSIAQQRIAHLESIVKCPTCDDLSVAQSNAPSAIAVRHEIVARVRAGASDTSILTALERQYYPGILLVPDAGALDFVLWAGPLAVVLIGLAIYVRLVRRR